MTDELRERLENLLLTIKEYENQLKETKKSGGIPPVHRKNISAVKVLYKSTKAFLKSNQTNCYAKVDLVKPISTSLFTRKNQVNLEVVAEGEQCKWKEEAVQLKFGILENRKNTVTRTLSLSSSELSHTGNDSAGIVNFLLTFEINENTVQIDFMGTTFQLQYVAYSAIKLDTKANAIQTKEYVDPFLANANTGLDEKLKEVFPSVQFIEYKDNQGNVIEWKTTFEPKSILKALEKTAELAQLPEGATALSLEELKEYNKEIRARKKELLPVNEALKKNLQRYIDLELNYEGKDSKTVFDKEYKDTIQSVQVVVDAISRRLKELEDSINQVRVLKKEWKVKNQPVKVTAEDKMQLYRDRCDTINEILISYPEKDLDFREWEEEMEAIKEKINALKNDLTGFWDTLEEKDQKDLKLNYDNLFKRTNNLLKHRELKSKEKDIEKIRAIDEDGFLEYKEGEDNFSDEEKRKYTPPEEYLENLKLSGGTFKLKHKDPELPLVDPEKGVEVDDIDQGGVGDCYLLAGLASIADQSPELIKEMVKEVDGKFQVTFYEGDIPIVVEVDNKLMYKDIKKMDGSSDKEKSGFLAAKPKDDIWVPIIEKAYAKLVADGDYAKKKTKKNKRSINGGVTEDVLKVLLGNKVKNPTKIYLDEAGNLTTQKTPKEFVNPVKLGDVSLPDLKKIILSARQEGHLLNVASPKSYKGGDGLTDEHILDIGKGNYMLFGHGYTLTAANDKEVTLFNPHGDDKEAKKRHIFDEQLKKDFETIKALALQKGKLSEESKAKIKNILTSNELLQKSFSRVMGSYKMKVKAVEEEDIAKGFVKRTFEIEDPELKVSYETLEYFHTLSITLLEKG